MHLVSPFKSIVSFCCVWKLIVVLIKPGANCSWYSDYNHLLYGIQAIPALLMSMCSGRLFSLNALTKSLVDWMEPRSRRINSTFRFFSELSLIRATAYACRIYRYVQSCNIIAISLQQWPSPLIWRPWWCEHPSLPVPWPTHSQCQCSLQSLWPPCHSDQL